MKRNIGVLLIVAGIFLRADSVGGGSGGASVGPSANAYLAATQTVGASTTTQLTFDTNQWDTGSIHSTSVNPTRFTAPSAGFYLLQCTTVTNAANKDIFGNFLVNGVTPTPRIANVTNAAEVNQTGAMVLTGIAKLSANDYVECSVFSLSGFTTVAGGSAMQMTKLSTTF